MQTRSLTLLVLFLMLSGISAWTQEMAMNTQGPTVDTVPKSEMEPATSPEEAEESKGLPFEISGAVDVYYQHSFIGTPPPTSFTEGVESFNLGMANVILSREGKVGFVADLAFGPRAEVANGFNGTTLAAIKQLFITYSPADWLTLTAGNYGTFVGYELIDAPDNINYTTSYLFSNGPFYHTGLKADVAFSDKFGAMVGIFNDTDSKFDFTGGKHLGFQLSYAGDAVEVYLNYLTGQEVEEDGPQPKVTGNQFDLVATYQVTEAFGLGINASRKILDAEEGQSQSWTGAALYANYAFSDLFTLGLRGEYMDDSDGLILGVADGSVFDLTVSGNFHIGDLTIIPEFRVDMASEEVFEDDQGVLQETLPTFLVAAVYSF